MQIQSLDVEGFRSLRAVQRWRPGALNVLIGPNGAGKSNLFRLIELAAASAQGRLGEFVQRSGGMEPLVWDGTARSIRFCARCSPIVPTPVVAGEGMIYELRLDRLGTSGEYRIGQELLGGFPLSGQGIAAVPFKFMERKGVNASIFDARQRARVAADERVPPTETFLSLAVAPFAAKLKADWVLREFRREITAWSVYHDVRTDQDSVIRQPAVTRHEKRVSPDGHNLIPVLHTLYTGNREFKNQIQAAMRAAFGGDFEELVFAPAADQRIQLRVRWKSLQREQSAADLSDGTLRFLFLLTVLASPEAAPLIAVDEPETGLHPSMLPIVAEYAVEAAQHTQVFFTTHSPQFLDAFGSTKPTTTVVLCEAGESRFKTITDPELDEWLRAYSLGSLFVSGELEGMA